MSYTLTITRGDNPTFNQKVWIQRDEWICVVESDADLVLSDEHVNDREVLALWTPGGTDIAGWVAWRQDGMLRSESPSPALRRKLHEIAQSLDANLVGDAFERYLTADQAESGIPEWIYNNGESVAYSPLPVREFDPEPPVPNKPMWVCGLLAIGAVVGWALIPLLAVLFQLFLLIGAVVGGVAWIGRAIKRRA